MIHDAELTDRLGPTPAPVKRVEPPRTFVKKSQQIVVQAFQMTRERRASNADWPNWLHEAWQIGTGVGGVYPQNYPNSDGSDALNIHGRHATYNVAWGDWIVLDDGDIFSLRPDYFARAYEPERDMISRPISLQRAVGRFLSWRLPVNFSPDCGITFKPLFNEHMPFGPNRHEPIGTNLLDAQQAEQMLRHVLELDGDA